MRRTKVFVAYESVDPTAAKKDPGLAKLSVSARTFAEVAAEQFNVVVGQPRGTARGSSGRLSVEEAATLRKAALETDIRELGI